MRWLVWLGLSTLVAAPALAQGQKPPKKERNRISREELVEAADKYSTLYEAIRNLRPQFLTVKMLTRGVRTTGVGPGSGSTVDQKDRPDYGGSNPAGAQPVVYIDGRKSGDPTILRSFSTISVEEVRYLSQNEALTEFGVGYDGGVIAVKLYLEKKP